MQSPDEVQLWCPSQSLWNVITENVPASEMPEIYAVLGHSLVDLYRDVHNEVEIWYRMWQESQQGSTGSRAGTPLARQRGSPLADPPAVKELLRSEVKMLLQTLRERASREGRDGEELVLQYKPETVDYVLGHLDSCHRNSINPGDTDTGSRPTSHCSVRSSAEEEIESIRDKLNVTDIDQVVDRLKFVLNEECEELRRLVKHLKDNIKEKCWSNFKKSEPTLAELKELRGAIQMDLELYPSSFAAIPLRPSPLCLKDLKHSIRFSAEHMVSEEPLRILSPTPALKPHPPRCQTHPRPPLCAPPTKTSASDKVINSPSLPRTFRQYRNTSASSGPRKIETPISSRFNNSGHMEIDSTSSISRPRQISDEALHDCSVARQHDSSSLKCTTFTSSPALKNETQRNSHNPGTHQSPQCRIQSPSTKCDLSPQMERRSSPAGRLKHIKTIPSSSHCKAGNNIIESTDHFTPTRRKSGTQNGQQNMTSGGRLVPKTEDQSGKTASCSSPAQTGSKETNNGTDRNSTSLKKDVIPQQRQVATCTRPNTIRVNRRFSAVPRRTTEGNKNQPKGVLETDLIKKLHQPVPPPRVST